MPAEFKTHCLQYFILQQNVDLLTYVSFCSDCGSSCRDFAELFNEKELLRGCMVALCFVMYRIWFSSSLMYDSHFLMFVCFLNSSFICLLLLIFILHGYMIYLFYNPAYFASISFQL